MVNPNWDLECLSHIVKVWELLSEQRAGNIYKKKKETEKQLTYFVFAQNVGKNSDSLRKTDAPTELHPSILPAYSEDVEED